MHEPELIMSADTIICPACTREARITVQHIAQTGAAGTVHCMCGRKYTIEQKVSWTTRAAGWWNKEAQCNPT